MNAKLLLLTAAALKGPCRTVVDRRQLDSERFGRDIEIDSPRLIWCKRLLITVRQSRRKIVPVVVDQEAEDVCGGQVSWQFTHVYLENHCCVVVVGTRLLRVKLFV